MAETCHRSGAKVYAADNPVRIGGLVFRSTKFTCKATGAKLTLATCVVATDPETGEKDVYLRGKEPFLRPHQVMDVNAQRVKATPDACFSVKDRKLNISGMGSTRGSHGDEHLAPSYGPDAVTLQRVKNGPRAPVSVNNVNKREIMHNGTHAYTGASSTSPPPADETAAPDEVPDEAPAEEAAAEPEAPAVEAAAE